MNTVSIVKCRKYDIKEVRQAVKLSFKYLGGIENYIKPGDRVLLKPNLLMKISASKGVTTHPVVIEAITREIQEAGGTVIIGDSPGGLFNKKTLKRVYRASGMEEVAQITGAVLNYNTEEIEVSYPEGRIIKSLKIAKMVEEVDVVISVAKLKTHGMMTYTGAVKNMFGIIPGMLKVEYHFRMQEPEDFGQMLIDICGYANPKLSFIDGITAMEGNGPSGGELRDVGLFMASDNPYALDLAAVSVIGFNIESVPTVKAAIKLGLCPSDIKDLVLNGENIEEIRLKDFKKPAHSSTINFLERFFPPFISKFLNNFIRPRPIFSSEICIGCEVCRKQCPPDAIKMVNSKPEVDYKKCIRCFCCHELCEYKAIKIKRLFK